MVSREGDSQRDISQRAAAFGSDSPAKVQKRREAIGQLRQAGLPIVVGSDSGNWPLMSYFFHGPTTLREIELLGESGFPAMEAIQAATATPARMLDLHEEIGTVEVGKQADLVVVREDPLEGLRALRSVAWTVQRGIARTPREWMDAGDP
jgi:imidazolonepropionase-like amidohydrolase